MIQHSLGDVDFNCEEIKQNGPLNDDYTSSEKRENEKDFKEATQIFNEIDEVVQKERKTNCTLFGIVNAMNY